MELPVIACYGYPGMLAQGDIFSGAFDYLVIFNTDSLVAPNTQDSQSVVAHFYIPSELSIYDYFCFVILLPCHATCQSLFVGNSNTVYTGPVNKQILHR